MMRHQWHISRYLLVMLPLAWLSSIQAAIILPEQVRPFSVVGNQIVSADNKPVRLQGVNWFGFESANLVVHGLWTRNYKDMMDQIKQVGFNTIRIPLCNEMFNDGAQHTSVNQQANPDLIGLTPIEVLDRIIQYADEIGLCIMLDHHRNDAGVGALNNGLWFMNGYPESRFISDWVMLAERYKNNPSVVAMDLHNEPHGPSTWGDGSQYDWKAAAERTGNAILAVNPHVLIVVEGIEFYNGKNYWWGGNLMGVRDYPVILNDPSKLVYSAHDYPNSIYAQPWFSDPSYPNNLPTKFREAWGYIFEENMGAMLIGEFGSRFEDPKDIGWIQQLVPYLNGDFNTDGTRDLPDDKLGINFTYWSWNPNSGDTGGILNNDWQTIDQVKMGYIQPIVSAPSMLGSVIDVTSQPEPDQTSSPNNDITSSPEETSHPQQPPKLRAQYKAGDASDGSMHAYFIIHNDSDVEIPLNEITVRYWYTADADTQQIVWVDGAATISCCNVTGHTFAMSTPTSNANRYLELYFAVHAGVLEPGANTGEISVQISNHDGSAVNQANDYSFDGDKTDFADWDHVTVYRNGTLIWGTEPGSSSQQEDGVSVAYTIDDQWATGFVTSITITNNSGNAINGWQLAFAFPNDQAITNAWNCAVAATDGNHVTLTNADWNGTIQAGSSVSIGFQGTYTGTNSKPQTFLLNGNTTTVQ